MGTDIKSSSDAQDVAAEFAIREDPSRTELIAITEQAAKKLKALLGKSSARSERLTLALLMLGALSLVVVLDEDQAADRGEGIEPEDQS